MRRRGTERNWEIVGLTDHGTVILRDTEKGGERDSGERPSEYAGVTYLSRAERGILRKGLTATGRDRPALSRAYDAWIRTG